MVTDARFLTFPAAPGRTRFSHLLRRLPLALLALCLSACATLQPPRPAPHSQTPAPAPATPLGRETTALHLPAAQSGFILLASGADALATRLWLIDQARKSLDVQYYILRDDDTGKLFLDALLRAAQRGVRVRLLLDDLNVGAQAPLFQTLARAPNVSVRFYNPLRFHSHSYLSLAYEYFTDGGKVDRRMHNKLLVADNEMAITGGRNIGDEYFQASSRLSFLDLDVLAAGPVVQQFAHSFDLYWNSVSAVPAAALPGWAQTAQNLPALARRLGAAAAAYQARANGGTPQSNALVGELARGSAPWVAAPAVALWDKPAKTRGDDNPAALLWGRFFALDIQPRKQLLLVSPYLVPGRTGMEWLRRMRSKGVSIAILTNSIATNDVLISQAGYERYRKAMLEAGIELHELKPAPDQTPLKHRLFGHGSSQASLHAKAYVIDDQDVFIGSYNLDPRSALLNTELGVLIESPALARTVAQLIHAAMSPAFSYRLALKPDVEGSGSHVVWITRDAAGAETTYEHPPHTGPLLQFGVSLLRLLPVQGQL